MGRSGQAQELVTLARKADVIIFRRAEISREVIEGAGNLKLIQRLGERPDGIDLESAAGHDVAVSCVPRRTLAYTAEHAILLMLAVAKKLVAADAICRSGNFDQNRVMPIDNVAYNWPGLSGLGGLWGRTLGIVGLGEVGSLVAQRARAFGMRVVYSKRARLAPELEKALGVEFADMDLLLRTSDFVSVHARATPETQGLIDASALALMKCSAILINTSRGSLIDEGALADALETSGIAGAGLDTHGSEPRPVPDRLSRLDNVILTPHVAGGSRLGLLDELEVLLRNCRTALTQQGEIEFAISTASR